MSSNLWFLRFHSAEQAEWLHPDGTVRQGPLTELAEQVTAGGRLLLVAPGEAVALHRASLPSRKRATWARAVPYALEEQLAEEVETLHFAFGNTLEGNLLPVAVVSHATLRTWVGTCTQAGLTPFAILPEPLLLPWQDADWSVLLDGSRAIVRTNRWEGFTVERENLGMLLNLALTEAGEAKPQRLRIWGDPPPEWAETGLETQIEDNPLEPLQVLASGYQPATVINLLRGHYHNPQAQLGRWLRPWRTAAVLAGVWLLAQGGMHVYEYGRLQRESVALRTAMEQVYRDAVPDATRIINPKVQLETRLRELRPSGAGSGAFFELLYQGGQPLVNFPGVTLRGFNYRDGQLDLDLEGSSPAALDQLRQRFNQQSGLRTEVRTTQRDGQVESKVTLKKAPS
ncbi:MAG: type II secretion system protein GspL [Candidatus Competibacteraceae bacterium]